VTMDDDEARLVGGFVSAVHREGDRVRRPASSDYSRRLLRHLHQNGWPYAPPLISAGRDHDLLGFVPGRAALSDAEQELAAHDRALAGVARIVRGLHDLTAGTDLAGTAEVACHNDLDPRNTVYRIESDGAWQPVALIDWDLAAPGLRVHDLAHVCWTFTGIGPGAAVARSRHRIAVVLGAYDFHGDVEDVLDTVLWWQDRCWRGIEAEAVAGDPAKAALRDAGVPARVRATYEWTRRHRRELR
jgi:Phosphotransferase enzyme family